MMIPSWRSAAMISSSRSDTMIPSPYYVCYDDPFLRESYDDPSLKNCYGDPFLRESYDDPSVKKCYGDPFLKYKSVKH
jgi:hypothetical protein